MKLSCSIPTRSLRRPVATALGVLALAASAARSTPPQYESPHVRPLVVAGNRLVVVNTPDQRLSIFDWNGSAPALAREVRVGMEPISVAVLDLTTAWVVNHLSDDVSIVDLATGTVIATVPVGDEPAAVGFVADPMGPPGATWAAITLSQENRVVFRETGSPYAEVASVAIPAEDPRALVVDADGQGLWIAVFESGNHTTLVPRWETPEGPWGHLNPPLPPMVPPLNPDLPPDLLPENGVIVRKIGGAWLDEQGGDWTGIVTWDVADVDLVHIDVSSGTPGIDRTVTGVGTLLYDLTTDPVTGDIWVVDVESHNDILFEPKLRGIFAENRLSRVPAPGGAPEHHSLNVTGLIPGSILAGPNEVLFSDASGTPEIYVTSIGGDHVAVIDPGTGEVTRRLPSPEGLSGIVESPDGGSLIVVNRFLNTLHVLDPLTGVGGGLSPVRSIGASGFDPTPAGVKAGRRFLYTGSHSQNGNLACASCHPHGNLDALAWDLGNPGGELKQLPPGQNGGVVIVPFHPLKGPMTTQALRGLVDVGPLHWRGDRTDFTRFNPAFSSLLGGDTLSTSQMRDYETFVLSIEYPPNPHRDHMDRPPAGFGGGDPVQGRQIFTEGQDGFCISCHALPLGTNGIVIPLNDNPNFGNQPMKTPQLRNLYDRTGFTGIYAPDNRRGFGYIHDGSDPTIADFLLHMELGLTPDERVDVEAFLMTFDTGTHGAIGRQVTLDTTIDGDPDRQQRLAELVEAAATRQVDLIVHGSTGEGERGWIWIEPAGGGFYRADRVAEVWSHDDLVAAAVSGAAVLTFTAVPAGQGIRMGVDRDEDGYYDRDELDLGTDPADPTSAPTVAVGDLDGASVAALTRVTGAHPLPFRSRTTVEIYLATSSEATVSVFDVGGRLVRRLASGRFDIGRHAIAWDGRNESGQPAAPGAYIVQLRTPAARHSMKLVRLD